MDEPRSGIPSALSRRNFLKSSALSGAALALTPGQALAAGASPFLLQSTAGALTSLRFSGDAFPTNYIETGQSLGHLLTTWRRPTASWQHLNTAEVPAAQKTILPAAHQGPTAGAAARYLAQDNLGQALEVESRLEPHGSLLRWSITLRNRSSTPLEIGDLALPLPMHSSFKADEPATASVLKHHFISGHGSFLFWMRSNSVGPFLVMTPEPSTHLEFWERTQPTKTTPPIFRAYIHSVAQAEVVAAQSGRWGQPHTGLTLSPNQTHQYAFQLAWTPDYAAVRQRLVDADLLDVEVAPGMSIPSDLSTTLALRSRHPIQSITPEHPEQTTLESLGPHNGRTLYRVRFARLGENLLTLHHADGRTTRLEFFSTEPLETLIHKRAAFIATHQHRDPSKWYNGLLAEWNMDSEVMLGPDNYDRIRSWRIYEVTCDDPGLSKPAFLASKLAEFPDQAQASALDDYIQHFVWGGLQRTTEESDSYGIYGILDWKQNRDSPDPGPKGRRHIWRPYDYSHIVVMYFGMYRVARDFPGIHTRLSGAAYLERAFGTALALFTIPLKVVDWSAYETGFYNEVIIPQLIDELDRVGQHDQAAQLRSHWEKKVAFFITGNPNLFGSEYAFDSTGFESTQAIARYALDHPNTPGTNPAATAKFNLTQIRANLFCRGILEKAYFYYGSDYRGEAGDAFTLSYMSQMGGWAVLNHALHDGSNDRLSNRLSDRREPEATVRLGYASFLSTWALMNTGTPETNFGYWFPGPANDGGTGGGFEPAAFATTWLGQPDHRGPWYYSCETDLGYCGALRSASTVLADDPVFGRFCFGGDFQATGDTLQITPRDGLRRRLHLRTAGQQIDLELLGARFAPDQPVHWSPATSAFTFSLETEPTAAPASTLLLTGLPARAYRLVSDPEPATSTSPPAPAAAPTTAQTFTSDGTTPVRLQVPTQPTPHPIRITPA